jgi:carbamoyltransferase
VFYGGLLCGLCGFDIWQGEEWKVMGLAPYGSRNQRIHELMHQCIRVEGLGLECPSGRPAALAELLTFARKPGAPPAEAADLAYTGQLVFTELMTELLNNLYDLGISENLVLGGGCALNSAYNGKILGQTRFRNLHVYAAPGDDGNALGAALLAFHDDHPDVRLRPRFQSPYLGSSMSAETMRNVRRFGRIPNITELPGRVHERAAQLLAEGRIIGWVQGRAEFGPRALGNRSILADPRPADMKDRINALVKFREEFRPFAPSILHEFGDDYFVDYQESPYMERTLQFREEVRDKVPAVVHVDGTGRLQSVKKQWNAKFHDLISEFYRITQVPILLNTSFNIMGKPIIHSVEDAIATFYTTGLDALIIEDCLIEKDPG